MFQVKARILDNVPIASDCFHMSLEAPSIARVAGPGQFIQVLCEGASSPLLRRPFSIHKVKNDSSNTQNQIDILYKRVGQGTALLNKKRADDWLDIIGPLGNGFNLPLPSSLPENKEGQSIVLVGGGIGVAPLLFLAQSLAHIKNFAAHIYILIGAKTKESILCTEEFKELGIEVRIATDDGSVGLKGTAAALLRGLLSTLETSRSTIYASGPKPMIREIARISREEEISCYLSLEGVIACGFGACLGCAVNTRKGYKLICKDGPVFAGSQLLWD